MNSKCNRLHDIQLMPAILHRHKTNLFCYKLTPAVSLTTSSFTTGRSCNAARQTQVDFTPASVFRHSLRAWYCLKLAAENPHGMLWIALLEFRHEVEIDGTPTFRQISHNRIGDASACCACVAVMRRRGWSANVVTPAHINPCLRVSLNWITHTHSRGCQRVVDVYP